ncbi:hypothetical protein LCGC14_0447170 [marine sediment metagenome]|uniref:Uncharacterized protein n=1 Tax=marine sediment metagenome TaxID=412755 RepID=A0A0F9V5Q7_9ZZZZ
MNDNCSRLLSALFILADRLYKNEIKKNQVNNSPILSPKSTRLQSRSAINCPFQTSNQTISKFHQV